MILIYMYYCVQMHRTTWVLQAAHSIALIHTHSNMCNIVRNAKESYNELHQVKALVPVAHIPDNAAHVCSLYNLPKTCNGQVLTYLWSIRACTSICDWHQCFSLAELVVALFYIQSSAAHICSLRFFHYLCSSPMWPFLWSIGACTSMHDQYRPSSLLQTPLAIDQAAAVWPPGIL
jgi:hypothetical protein